MPEPSQDQAGSIQPTADVPRGGDEPTQLLANLAEVPEPDSEFAHAFNVEISGPRRIFVVRFGDSAGIPGAPQRVALFAQLDEMLETSPSLEIDVVEMMTVPTLSDAKPIIQRVNSILALCEGDQHISHYLVVTDAGEVVSMPEVANAAECQNYRLVFLAGTWVSPTTSRKLRARSSRAAMRSQPPAA